jgi:hypothetical protein
MAMHRPANRKPGIERNNPADGGIRQTRLSANTKTTKRRNGETGLNANLKSMKRASCQTHKRLNEQTGLRDAGIEQQTGLVANTETKQREYTQTLKQG